MFEVTVTGMFVATHQLRRPDGSREPRHGHAWRVRLTFAGPELDERGLLVDFGAVRERLEAALEGWRGRHLNDLPELAGREPSAEVVAAHLAGQLAAAAGAAARLAWVEIEEEPGCLARYRPPDSAGPPAAAT